MAHFEALQISMFDVKVNLYFFLSCNVRCLVGLLL